MDNDHIIAYLKKDFNACDKGNVEQWIAKNMDEFKRIKYVWEKSGANVEEEPDLEVAWMRINPESRIQTKNQKKKLKILSTTFQRIAAILIIALSISFFVYHQCINVENTKMVWIEHTNSTNSVQKIQLTDGSNVWLNVASKIRYPKLFNIKIRGVYLEGEAFFEVEHNKRKPFIVYTRNAITKDLGTSFNVNSLSSGDVQVTVVTGSVALSGTKINSMEVVLKQGEVGLFTVPDQRVEKQQNKDLNFLAWKTGKLTFSKMPLENVCEELSKYYKTKVYLNNETLKQINLTATYDHKNLHEVLEIIHLTLGIQYQYNDSSVVLSLKK